MPKEIKETIKRRDGKIAEFIFTKLEGSVWYWDLPDGKSIPLPDVNLDKAKRVRECLALIGEKRGEDWVGQIITDLLNKDWN